MLIQLIIGILFIIGLYVLTSDEEKWLKVVTYAYFLLLTIIFVSGYIHSIDRLQSYEMANISNLRKWVYLFGYLYTIPLMAVAMYIWVPYAKQFNTTRMRVFMISLILFIILTSGHFLNIFFRVLFYGVA